MPPNRWNIPNLLSLSRLLGVPFLWVLVHVEPVAWFIVLYALLGLTDYLDGRLARAWGQTSEFGSMLDSVADVAYYVSTAYFVIALFPGYIVPNVPWLAGCLLALMALIVFTRFRFGRVLLPHTHLSRLAGALVVAAMLLSFLVDTTILFRFIILLYTVAFLEMILMFRLYGEVELDTRTILRLRAAGRLEASRQPAGDPSAPGPPVRGQGRSGHGPTVPLLTLLLLAAQACASGTPATRSDRGPDRTVIHTEAGALVVESRPHEEVRWEPVAAPIARVFRALPDVYELLEIPVETLDPDRLLVGNGDHRVFGSMGGVRMNRLFDCGRAGGLGEDLANSETLRISLVTQVRSAGPASAQVRTEAVARVRGGGVTGVHRSDCASTGLLEAVIADLTRHLAESR
jgi:cardiolipin synthase (CMP-forming)